MKRDIAAGNMPALLGLFANPFLAATPQGAKIVTAADFAEALPARKQLFDRMGWKSSSLVDVHSIPLSARYALLLTEWRMNFAAADSSRIELLVDSAFVVDTGTEAFKIILYLAGDDIMALLKERGTLQN